MSQNAEQQRLDERGRRGLVICAVVSLVLGILWALRRYHDLSDVRAWNLVGLVFITVVFFYAIFIAITASRAAKQHDASRELHSDEPTT